MSNLGAEAPCSAYEPDAVADPDDVAVAADPAARCGLFLPPRMVPAPDPDASSQGQAAPQRPRHDETPPASAAAWLGPEISIPRSMALMSGATPCCDLEQTYFAHSSTYPEISTVYPVIKIEFTLMNGATPCCDLEWSTSMRHNWWHLRQYRVLGMHEQGQFLMNSDVIEELGYDTDARQAEAILAMASDQIRARGSFRITVVRRFSMRTGFRVVR